MDIITLYAGEDRVFILYDRYERKAVTDKSGNTKGFATRTGARGTRSFLMRGVRPLHTR